MRSQMTVSIELQGGNSVGASLYIASFMLPGSHPYVSLFSLFSAIGKCLILN